MNYRIGQDSRQTKAIKIFWRHIDQQNDLKNGKDEYPKSIIRTFARFLRQMKNERDRNADDYPVRPGNCRLLSE